MCFSFRWLRGACPPDSEHASTRIERVWVAEGSLGMQMGKARGKRGDDGAADIKHERRSPSFDEMLPYVVSKLVRVRQLLDEVLDGILSEAEEVGS